MVVVTEQGYADLRGLTPKERAVKYYAVPIGLQGSVNGLLQRACNKALTILTYCPRPYPAQ